MIRTWGPVGSSAHSAPTEPAAEPGIEGVPARRPVDPVGASRAGIATARASVCGEATVDRESDAERDRCVCQSGAVCSARRARFSSWRRAMTRSPSESSGAIARPRRVTTFSSSRVVGPSGTST